MGKLVKLSGDFRWLVQHNGYPTWHVVKDVPMKLRKTVGKPRLIRSLGTHDITTARSLRWAVLADFEKILQEVRGGPGPDRAIRLGLEYRATLGRIEAGDPNMIQAHTRYGDLWGSQDPSEPAREPRAVARDNAEADISLMAEELPHREAEVFMSVAYGHATPLLHHVDDWLAEGGTKGPLRPRTASQYRADLTRLTKWLSAAGLPVTLEAVTKAVAGRYVTETMVRTKVESTTGNRWISAASAYWKWLGKRGVAEANPWIGQSLNKSPARLQGERRKRPYTDDEMSALLRGTPGKELEDVIRVAALSGMRLEEIYRLTVADCADQWFRVRESKTQAGVRRVPVHTGVAGIVGSRCEGKEPTAFLFHEPGPGNKNRERSAAVSKRFGRYRKDQGVDETTEGRRASAVDFHSLRRWFITVARQRYDRGVVAAVVGHEAGNITDDVYSAGPNDALKRELVEFVRLPVKVC